jgi:endonuclease G
MHLAPYFPTAILNFNIMKKYIYTCIILFIFALQIQAQIFEGPQLSSPDIQKINAQIDSLNQAREHLKNEIEIIKLQQISNELDRIAIPELRPGDEVIRHSAMFLCYDEAHEQAKWVAHIISPDVITGGFSRSNDFREDPKVKTGTAVKEDYWDTGYDRGHMAPSADFRWSKKALSESYFYSNMSPQKPELNRESWAILEDRLRYTVITSGEPLIVITGPVLEPGLPNIGTVNKVTIPKLNYKVALDLTGTEIKGIGFIMRNGKNEYPTFSYAVTIDSIEKITGINFFASLPEDLQNQLESKIDISLWKSEKEKGEIEPIPALQMPKGKFNTVQAKYQMNANATICGTVVDARFVEKSGNTFMNLDKRFPNDIFSVSIWKNDRVNFSYAPETLLINKQICVTGMVRENNGKATMSISNEKAIEYMDGSRPGGRDKPSKAKNQDDKEEEEEDENDKD